MPDEVPHTCSYYCERPECVRAQRDELRGMARCIREGCNQMALYCPDHAVELLSDEKAGDE